jgi:hypothetical protein
LTDIISLIIIIIVSDGDGSCGREDKVRHIRYKYDMIYNMYYIWINFHIYHTWNIRLYNIVYIYIVYIMQSGATEAVEATCISQTGWIGTDEERHTR